MVKAQNVGHLKELIGSMKDSIFIVSPAKDHSYRPVSIHAATVIYDKSSDTFSEDPNPSSYLGEEIKGLGVRVLALVAE